MRVFALKAVSLGLAVCAVFAPVRGAPDHSSLLDNSPFCPTTPDKSAAAAQQQLELRGVVREGGAVFLTFFDPVSKKWTTRSPGEESDDIAVESFDATSDAVVLRLNGRAMTIAFKPETRHVLQRSPTAVAASPTTATPETVVVLGPSPSEARRLAMVAAEIRQKVEQAGRLSAPTSAPSHF